MPIVILQYLIYLFQVSGSRVDRPTCLYDGGDPSGNQGHQDVLLATALPKTHIRKKKVFAIRIPKLWIHDNPRIYPQEITQLQTIIFGDIALSSSVAGAEDDEETSLKIME